MRFRPWIPPLAWMGVIFWLSTPSFSEEGTGGWILPILRALLPWASPVHLDFIHWLGRKTGHVTEYAILAWLWHRAFSRTRRGDRPLAAFGLTVGYAIFDELHQGWTGSRGASALDVVLDAFGGGTALAFITWGWRRAPERLTGALLWLAAAGGSLLLLVHLAAGAPPRWLWASVPLAWMALWAWRRRAQQRRLDSSGTRE
ncbi:MAG: VanZ family protein [Candidatus Rokubacteria bacterium]|nr:VanZ family protein [Candidatus Rokubacteria bacterium]